MAESEQYKQIASRIFKSADFMQQNDAEPIRSVITESSHATVVAWYVRPQQRISAHVHPLGQDTWTILAGSGHYQTDATGTMHIISAGDVVVAHENEVHGVLNCGSEPLIFISVVCPFEAGYALL